MTMTINDATRVGRVRARRMMVLLALAAAGTATPSAWAFRYVFRGEVAVPKNAPTGTVLARAYITDIDAEEYLMTDIYNSGWPYTRDPTVPTTVSGVSARLLINGQAYENGRLPGGAIKMTQPLEVQLLADGRTITGGSLDKKGSYFDIHFWNPVRDYRFHDLVFMLGTVKPIDGTCSVPAQTVKLPNVSLNKFGGVGSTVGSQSFQIRINNCPRGYNRIGYTLSPRGGAIANAPGVLPLTTDSTASGVKIRVADDKGVPAAFDTSIKVDDYSKTTGGSYAIPMQAAYIKTDATIKPGTVNGAMTVLLDYQ
ncbi:fimbrial protein [Burkholderia sp. SIMBA_062]|uniref:fimbrial protein n=1 Tax=Burkholderia sp. SIMBA_062 TaxID=3085803 RepID=UPI003979BC8C